jgi:hypothetical protein
MSEIGLTEKLSETLLNAFKNTNLFEKLKKIEFRLNSVILFSSILGLTCLYIHFDYKKNLTKIDNHYYEIDKLMKENNVTNILVNNAIRHEISIVIENQNRILHKLIKLKQPIVMDNYNQTELGCISATTSMSDFPSIDLTNTVNTNPECSSRESNSKETEYDELLNECYDVIPLNNLKKNTGLSWLFK